MPSKIQLIKGLYERGWAADEVRRLFRVIDWMMDLPEAAGSENSGSSSNSMRRKSRCLS